MAWLGSPRTPRIYQCQNSRKMILTKTAILGVPKKNSRNTSPSHSRLARTSTTKGTADNGPLWAVEEAVILPRPRLRLYPCFLAHPVSFPFRVSLQHPLVSSLVSRGNSAEIINSRALRLVWAQNQPTLGNIPGILRVYLENPGIPGKYLGIVPISSILPQILPQTSSQTQGNSRVSRGKLERNRMEHQTPSGFPGNFRKRKVLGTLSFPFWFPETCMQANVPPLHHLTGRRRR